MHFGTSRRFMIIDFAAQALIGVHFGTSRIQFGCAGVDWGASRSLEGSSGVILSSMGLDWGASWSLKGPSGV